MKKNAWRCWHEDIEDLRHRRNLAALEEQNSNLGKVEVDKVLCLVCDIGAEVTADNAVPGGAVLLVKFLFNVCSDVFLDVVLLECLGCAVNDVLLHLLGHVRILDDCLTLCHFSVFLIQAP